MSKTTYGTSNEALAVTLVEREDPTGDFGGESDYVAVLHVQGHHQGVQLAVASDKEHAKHLAVKALRAMANRVEGK